MTHPSLDFGYAFSPDSPPDRPAHRVLTVVLRPAPTERHYDPERAEWPVVSRDGDLDTLTLYHPWPESGAYRAAAGRVILTDRKRKVVEAFTFGGALHVEAAAEQVVARLESPAPILPLLTPASAAALLADQVEVLLALRRAAWDSRGQRGSFEERLAGADPHRLYSACLAHLHAELRGGHAPFADPEQKLSHLVRAAAREMQDAGHWPASATLLEELL
jgi:hypothetical protein